MGDKNFIFTKFLSFIFENDIIIYSYNFGGVSNIV